MRDEGRIINLNRVEEFPPSYRGESVSIEGGDIMIINKDYLLIGCSERTTAHTIHSLRDELFKRGVIENVVQVNIPIDRSYMHIDTIFTQISNRHVVAYKPIVIDGLSSYVEVFSKSGTKRFYHSIRDFSRVKLVPIWSSSSVVAANLPTRKESNGPTVANLVTVKPGVAITYDRNPKTELAFHAHGYQTIGAEDLLRDTAAGILDPTQLENTIVLLPSNELSRARGGSHCMTCPIERQ